MEEEITVQVEKNTSSTERLLCPITYITWILGVGIARPQKRSKAITVVLRVIHFGLCSVIVAYGAIDFFTFGNVFKSDIFKIMYYTNKVVCYVASYYYVLHVIKHYNRWTELTRKFDALNERFRQEFPVNDRPVTNAQILAVVLIIFFGPLSLIIHALYYYFTLPDDIFASDLLLYYTIAQSLANSFIFDTVVYVTRRRFRMVNKLIRRLDERLGASWIALKVRRIRELHNGVCDLVTLINNIYGIQLLLCSANSFTMVVATLFRIYMGVVEKNYEFMMINNVIWMIYVGQFALTCWICTVTCRETEKTGILLHTIVLNCKRSTKFGKLTSFKTRHRQEDSQVDVHQHEHRNICRFDLNYFGIQSLLRTNFERDCVRNEVNDFSTQLQQHRVFFSACDFFEINNNLLTGFVGVITTYLIILVQFYRPEHQMM